MGDDSSGESCRNALCRAAVWPTVACGWLKTKMWPVRGEERCEKKDVCIFGLRKQRRSWEYQVREQASDFYFSPRCPLSRSSDGPRGRANEMRIVYLGPENGGGSDDTICGNKRVVFEYGALTRRAAVHAVGNKGGSVGIREKRPCKKPCVLC